MRKRLLDLPGVTYVLALLIAVLAFSSDGFLSAGNLSNIALQGSLLLMLALPMTFVILTEGLDLFSGSAVSWRR
jgi:ribose transport system permease protein